MLDRDQVEGSLEQEVVARGMGVVAFSPLSQGILTGKYNSGVPSDSRAETVNWFREQLTEDRLGKARAITALANEMGVSSAALALAWVLKNPVVSSAIIGASRPSQIDENLKALDVKITDEIAGRISAILGN
jgi:aryl-alcohol dehydrogenase-like predicted oxidoreductase